MVGVRRIKSEKLRKHKYREGYARSLERMEVEWDEENSAEHMLEQLKRPMVERAREVCGSMKVREKPQKLRLGKPRLLGICCCSE